MMATPTDAQAVGGDTAGDAGEGEVRRVIRPARPRAARSAGLRAAAGFTLAWALGALWFFRPLLTSGFDRLGGDDGDARLIALIQEHWFRVVRGAEAWNDLSFFHPADHVLGYSDTFLLHSLVFVPLRFLGVDPFLASELTIVALSAFGFAGFVLLCRRLTSLPGPMVAGLAALYCFSNGLQLKHGHPQLFSLWVVPPVLYLATRAVQASERRASVLWGAAAGFLYGLCLFSTFYVAWFMALAAIVAGVPLLIGVALTTGPRPTVRSLTGRWPELLGAGIGLGLMLVPFAANYLPVLEQSGGRTYDVAMSLAARPVDVVNLGEGNLVWGRALRPIFEATADGFGGTEHTLAPTPLLVIVVAAAGLWSLVTVLRGRRDDWRLLATAALAFTTIALLTLPVRFSWGSLWMVPWNLVPGATGVRVIARVLLMAGAVATLTLTLALDALWSRASGRVWARVALSGLLVVLLVEQVNTTDDFGFDRRAQLDLLASSPEPPDDCTSFFVIDDLPTHKPYYASNLDAAMLSTHFGLPTLNGYSGGTPPDFNPHPELPGYVEAMDGWEASNGLTDVCAFSLGDRTWRSEG